MQTKRELSGVNSSPWLESGSLLLQWQHLATKWGSRVTQTNFSSSGILFPLGCLLGSFGGKFFLLSPVLTPTPAHLQAQTIARGLRCSCSGTLAHSGVSVTPLPESGRIALVSNEHNFLGSLSIPVRLWWLPYSMMVGRTVTDEGSPEPQSDSGFLKPLWWRRFWNIPRLCPPFLPLSQWFSYLRCTIESPGQLKNILVPRPHPGPVISKPGDEAWALGLFKASWVTLMGAKLRTLQWKPSCQGQLGTSVSIH